jgi:branched-chain amino acid transport system permease protein
MQKIAAKWGRNLIDIAVLAVFFAIVQYLITAGLLNQYYEINLTSMFINIILAVSLNLINGFTGQLSLGHAGFMAVGAYTAVVLTQKMALPFPLEYWELAWRRPWPVLLSAYRP